MIALEVPLQLPLKVDFKREVVQLAQMIGIRNFLEFDRLNDAANYLRLKIPPTKWISKNWQESLPDWKRRSKI
ncbi:MAG TPA: hypothetical protein IGS17_01555 [Oscillatoriales cyanobacterium M59_W2019_021]|nr:hypothetical protein [Oscillatoriales cyanobacterium M4454_W2019_049]HIK49601.1 hypothetical protein [Oscillatoriales cyanobacterium M59_W2019_021]